MSGLDLGPVETDEQVYFKGTELRGNRAGGESLCVSDDVVKLLADKFEKIVNDCKNPHLTEIIMRLVHDKREIPFENIPMFLKVGNDEAAETVKYLNESGALWIKESKYKKNSVRLVNDAVAYLSSKKGFLAYEKLPYNWEKIKFFRTDEYLNNKILNIIAPDHATAKFIKDNNFREEFNTYVKRS